MISDQAATDRHGLERWLRALWDGPVEVSIAHYSTAGARRRNLIFDVAGRVHAGRFVATILPTSDIALMSMVDEAAVRAIARANGVLVPRVIGVCRDENVVGGEFFVSEFIAGETIPRRLLRLVDDADSGERIVSQIGDALARLHAVEPDDVPSSLRTPDQAVRSAAGGVADAVAGLPCPEPAFDYALRWLREREPSAPARETLVHADVRTGNIIVDTAGLQAILDWETAKIGDPMEDLAWTCTRMWRFGRDDRPVGGLGAVETLRNAYVEAGGEWDEERFQWWRVLTTLRWGTGLAGQAAAHLDGTFPSVVMAASGRRIAEIAYDVLTLTDPACLSAPSKDRTTTGRSPCPPTTRGNQP